MQLPKGPHAGQCRFITFDGEGQQYELCLSSGKKRYRSRNHCPPVHQDNWNSFFVLVSFWTDSPLALMQIIREYLFFRSYEIGTHWGRKITDIFGQHWIQIFTVQEHHLCDFHGFTALGAWTLYPAPNTPVYNDFYPPFKQIFPSFCFPIANDLMNHKFTSYTTEQLQKFESDDAEREALEWKRWEQEKWRRDLIWKDGEDHELLRHIQYLELRYDSNWLDYFQEPHENEMETIPNCKKQVERKRNQVNLQKRREKTRNKPREKMGCNVSKPLRPRKKHIARREID